MTTHKQTIEITAEELTVLNKFCEKRDTPFSLEELATMQTTIESLSDAKAWIRQGLAQDNDILDVIITADFEDGMILDVWYWGMVNGEKGVYSGIQFGDKYSIFIEPNEFTENCYAIEQEGAEPEYRPCVEGSYKVFYNNDIYELEIKKAA